MRVAAAALLCMSSTAALAVPVGQFENLTPVKGLGKGTNTYAWSMAGPSFNDDLFVGTFSINFDWFAAENYLSQITDTNAGPLAPIDAFRRIWSGSPITPTLGAEIHRYDGENWVQEFGPSDVDGREQIVGFRSMVEHDGHLYAGTANGPTGPFPFDDAYNSTTVNYLPTDGSNLYKRDDSGVWTEITTTEGPGSNNRNASIRTMLSAGGKLWVGTENPADPFAPPNTAGPELWSYSDTDGWVLETKLESGLAIGELAHVDGKIMIGTWATAPDGGFEVLSYDPSDSMMVNVTPDIPGLDGSNGVMEFREFDGKFFVGTLDYTGGFKLLYTEDDDIDGDTVWTPVTTDGFASEFGDQGGTTANAYPWSSVEIDGVYYLGTFNTNKTDSVLDILLGTDLPLDGRGQIWYSQDGIDWKILEDNGFDTPFTYGIRELVDWQGNLTAGTASNLFVPDLLNSPYPEYVDMALDEFLNAMQTELPTMMALLGDAGMSDQQMARLLGWGQGKGGFGLPPYKGFEVYSAPSIIPLPAGLVLLLSGLLTLPVLRRRGKTTA
ncbi:MAG: hypothetical protein AAF871_15390 [Pseudomonadota bacterium]